MGCVSVYRGGEMIGLIVKVFAFFGVLIIGALMALHFTGTWTAGTVRLTAPDVAPCHRWVEANHPNRDPVLVQVRWIWAAEDYGWGCHIEFSTFNIVTVTPMPE
jgi:hypothetical protein